MSTKFHQLLVICDSFCSWMATNLIHNCNLIMTQKIMSWQPLHLRCQNLEILTFFQSIDPKNWFSIEFWFLLESLWLFCVFIISKLWKILLIDDWAMPDLKKIRIQVSKVSQIRVKCQNCWILTSEMLMLSLSTLSVMIKITIMY